MGDEAESLGDEVISSSGLDLFEDVERVPRLSAGVVERPGSKPSSSLSGAVEAGFGLLAEPLSWALL